MICEDRNSAMLFFAWSKILDKAAVLVAVAMSLKTLCWLVWHLKLALLSYFCLQQQGINEPGGKGFFKCAKFRCISQAYWQWSFQLRVIAVSWQSPLSSLFACVSWTPSPETQAVTSGTYTSASKLQESLNFCASPGLLPKPNVIACPADARRVLTICNSPCLILCTELFGNFLKTA